MLAFEFAALQFGNHFGHRIPPFRHKYYERQRLWRVGQQAVKMVDRRFHELFTKGRVGFERTAHRIEVKDRPENRGFKPMCHRG